MHKSLKNKLLLVIGIAFISTGFSAHALETSAKQAYMFNPQTGTVLFEHNADELMPPSSMTKIMTAYMIFEQLAAGDVTVEDEFPVSKLAWRKGGSKMFVMVGSHVKVGDLLQGIIVQSGNDACIVVAEALSGNEGVFAADMTRKAKELGATNTTFKNSTGWPDPLHVSTARDLGIIAHKLMDKFPDYYKKYFSQPEFTYNKIRQENRNPLLKKNIGVDGLKTGSTDAGGYGIVVSGEQNGQRLILVVNGLKTASEREEEAERILTWGLRSFASPVLFKKGEEVAKTNVWLGNKPKISLALDKDLVFTMPRNQIKDLKVEAIYDEPIDVGRVGQIVGKVVVSLPDREPIEAPLRAVGDVKSASFFSRISAAIHYLVWGHNEQPA
jgi:serine-type D-Ala-D-Ala carboxypeptidase (penicillin-binding protein 5/6)